MDWGGVVQFSSEESAGMIWQHCLLKEQVEGGVEEGTLYNEKQMGNWADGLSKSLNSIKNTWFGGLKLGRKGGGFF